MLLAGLQSFDASNFGGPARLRSLFNLGDLISCVGLFFKKELCFRVNIENQATFFLIFIKIYFFFVRFINCDLLHREYEERFALIYHLKTQD